MGRVDSKAGVGERYAAAIDRMLAEPKTAAVVAEYLNEENQFAALSFDKVGPNHPYRIGDDDILAVSFLDAPIQASAYRQIMQAQAQDAFSELLEHIDRTLELWNLDETSNDYVNALALWEQLDAIPNMGPTRVSKLMARKRPHLIPILDERVREFFDHETEQFWLPLGHALKGRSPASSHRTASGARSRAIRTADPRHRDLDDETCRERPSPSHTSAIGSEKWHLAGTRNFVRSIGPKSSAFC